MKLICKWQNTRRSWQNEFIYWKTLTYFTRGVLYWMKQLFTTKTNFVKIGCSLSNEHFLIVPAKKSVTWTQKFLSACFCWDARLSSREMDQKIKFGGTIGYGDSYLEFLFRHFKVITIPAILHDAAGARRHTVAKVQVTVTWFDEDQIHDCLVKRLDYSFAFT